MTLNRKHSSGFTLVEISVVLVIVGILLVGALSTLGEKRAVTKQLETEKTLQNIKQQLLKFAMINKYLPCPGVNGREARTAELVGTDTINRCTNDLGAVPYLDIGLKRDEVVDAYGNLVRYAINQEADIAASICNRANSASYFCNATPGTAVFDLVNTPPTNGNNGTGNYTVCNENTSSCSGTPSDANIDTNVASVVLVAFNEDGAQTINSMPGCSGIPSQNVENCDSDAFYHRSGITSVEGEEFDDVIEVITGYEIKSKILSPITVWNRTPPANVPLVPTYRAYALTPGDYTPLDDANNPDVIQVDQNIAAALNLGAGDDVVLVGGDLSSKLEYINETGEITSDGDKADLDTGSGNDSVYIANSANSNVNLGVGDDMFVLGGDLTRALYADAGQDQVWIKGNVESGSTLQLGADDDVLWIGTADKPETGNINQVIDGGTGVDILVLENYENEEAFWAAPSSQYLNITGIEYILFADDGSGNRPYCTWSTDCDGTNN
ncbi:MAG: type II secretion system protein [Thiotrichales bacterium]|nr:type II secretion system protein [Thiotrichales bacterium]